MGTWKYRKTEPSNIRGICVCCHKNPQAAKSKGKFKALCSYCNKKLYQDMNKHKESVQNAKRPYRIFRKDSCEKCGFIPEHPCQLDVDHINGDHSDNREENLKTLCANCHRLKTYQSNDWVKK